MRALNICLSPPTLAHKQQLRDCGLSSNGSSPLAANISASPPPPLQGALEVLDLGGNPSLAWAQPADEIFAGRALAPPAGFVALREL